MGSADKTFKKRWDDITREAESNFLQAQLDWVSSQKSYYEKLAADCEAALKEAMHAHPEEYKDAEAAITKVASRVRAETLTAERKKYAVCVERHETEVLGVDLKRPNNKKGRTQQPREPQPGSSNGGRVFKQARRTQGNKGNISKGAKNQEKALSNLLQMILTKKWLNDWN